MLPRGPKAVHTSVSPVAAFLCLTAMPVHGSSEPSNLNSTAYHSPTIVTVQPPLRSESSLELNVAIEYVPGMWSLPAWRSLSAAASFMDFLRASSSAAVSLKRSGLSSERAAVSWAWLSAGPSMK